MLCYDTFILNGLKIDTMSHIYQNEGVGLCRYLMQNINASEDQIIFKPK